MVITYSYGLDFEQIDTALKNYLGAKYIGLRAIPPFKITIALSEDLTAEEKQTIKQHLENLNFRKLFKTERVG
jgi:hypothetical protein